MVIPLHNIVRKQKEEAQLKTNEIVIKKAKKLKSITARKERELKTMIGDDGDDDDVDEIVEHITKKPKKKRIIYKTESDGEEEVTIKKAPNQKRAEPSQSTFRINFC